MRKFSTFSLLPLAAALAATGAFAAASLVMPGASAGPRFNSVPTVTTTTPTSGTSGTGANGGTTSGGTGSNTSTAGSNTTTNSTNTSPANATTVINAQGTPSSATASGAPTAGQTSGVSIAGTSSGDAFSGASRGNAPPVGSAATTVNANGTPTTVATNGAIVTLPAGATQTQTTNGAIVTTLNGPLGVPVITDNSALAGGVVGLNGEQLANPAAPAGSDFSAFSDVTAAQSAAPQVGVATSALSDPLVRKELRKRQNVKRNSQLLYSVAPRTNVDRSYQMPDDPITPALHPPS